MKTIKDDTIKMEAVKSNKGPSATSNQPSVNNEVLVRVEGVSKKFCRDLKRSLWYGIKDLCGEFLGLESSDKLRENEFWAVYDVNFELRRGECLGLIGHNGAGKSTLLKMLNGLITPDKGRIEMHGRVGALIELGTGFNPILTGRENIYNNGAVLGFTREEINQKFDDIVAFSEIGDFIDTPVQNYSSGMKVRLGFAVAAQMEPDVLIIDEVLAVGDIGFRIKCMDAIHKILKNSAVIFVTHSMQQISRICNVGLLMHKGKIQLSTNNIGELTENYLRMYSTGNQVNSGIGKSVIDNVSIINHEEEATKMVDHNRAFKVVFKLINNDQLKSVHARLIIFSLENRPVFDYYSGLKGNPINIDSDEFIVSCTVPPITLNTGKYSLSVVIIDPINLKVICRMDNALSFTVSSSYMSYSENFSYALWETQSCSK